MTNSGRRMWQGYDPSYDPDLRVRDAAPAVLAACSAW